MLSKRITRRDFLKIIGLSTLNLLLAGIGGVGYSALVEPGWLDVEEVGLKLPRLSPAFAGFKIVQISDIHLGGWMNKKRFRQVVQKISAQAPDLVVITGDFVIGRGWNERLQAAVKDLREELSVLTENHQTLAVLGNHDYWTNAKAIRASLGASDVKIIRNDVHTLFLGGNYFHIAGVDDVWAGHDRLDVVLKKMPKRGAAILLAHEPDFADTSVRSGRFDLQLSGHSHGGQFVIPFVGPLRLPYLGQKYTSGLYRIGEMWQYTNRGVGMISPYVRLNCRPEITVFTLESA